MDPSVDKAGAARPPRGRRWYVSFDCATKTFAFCLAAYDPEWYAAERVGLWAEARRQAEGLQAAAKALALLRLAAPPRTPRARPAPTPAPRKAPPSAPRKALPGGPREPPAKSARLGEAPPATPAGGTSGTGDAGEVGVAAAGAQRVAARLATLAAGMRALEARLGRALEFVDGDAADLFPGTPDAEVHTVRRIRAIVQYVRCRVLPVLAAYRAAGDELTVLVEYQMGPNAPARTVAAALVALFADADVRLVGPSLKNQVALSDEGQYCFFAERYTTSYAANKAHALYNFKYALARIGGAPRCAENLWGHVADAFMQILGYAVTGESEEESLDRF